MSVRKAITLQLEAGDYDRLAAEAKRLGMSPGALARVYVRTALAGNGETAAERRRRAGLAALQGLAALRDRLPEGEPVDVVQLIRDGREELDRRTAL
ncbi:MAG: hypothetical protein HY690_11920 [Chloroflexi bacterium]|nr:hypothetical protein [Chloroflexota bacterium]